MNCIGYRETYNPDIHFDCDDLSDYGYDTNPGATEDIGIVFTDEEYAVNLSHLESFQRLYHDANPQDWADAFEYVWLRCGELSSVLGGVLEWFRNSAFVHNVEDEIEDSRDLAGIWCYTMDEYDRIKAIIGAAFDKIYYRERETVATPCSDEAYFAALTAITVQRECQAER